MPATPAAPTSPQSPQSPQSPVTPSRRERVPVPAPTGGVTEVCFTSQAGNAVRFGCTGPPPQLTYSVSGAPRQPPRRIVFRQGDRGLEFPGSGTAGTKLPREGLAGIVGSLRELCDRCRVEHNFPGELDLNTRDAVLARMQPAAPRSRTPTGLHRGAMSPPPAGVDPLSATYAGAPLAFSPISPTAPGSAQRRVPESPRSPRPGAAPAPAAAAAAAPPRQRHADPADGARSSPVRASPARAPQGSAAGAAQRSSSGTASPRAAPAAAAQRAPLRPPAPVVLLAYDERVMRHAPPGYATTPDPAAPDADPANPERPQRVAAIWRALEAAGLLQRCQRVPFEPARRSDLELAHNPDYVQRVQGGDGSVVIDKMNVIRTHVTQDSYLAATLAAGAILELVKRVVSGSATSGFALSRPPGHHAERAHGMGFCLFNNVAVAALHAKRALGVRRVFILDWDVHHGNGVQSILEEEADIFYTSLHVRAAGRFYPGSGRANEVGTGPGAGRTLNIPWSKTGMGDPEYFAAFDALVLPIARSFDPDLVIVCAGFDAAAGDPLGGCNVTPAGFARMTQQLCGLAQGRVVLALEGGYSLRAISDSAVACVQALVDIAGGKRKPPTVPAEPWAAGGPWEGADAEAVANLAAVARFHVEYWPVLREQLDLMSKAVQELKLQAVAQHMAARMAKLGGE
eukprot:TRINITY_DN20411_c0_g1_i1.p1 TRINITY_DN20411_c0_g1~~TRINITY_DN20411_c0_g1_i1.p1  ORF type:complete len:713 (+),score=134.21 TRINITY_DN20411_c0_g1_i1:90-2141(+)